MDILRTAIHGSWEKLNILQNGRELLIKTFCAALKV